MFKQILISFGIAASLLVAPALSHAQATRVAVVNTDRVLSEAKIAQASQQKLQQEFSAREQQLTAQRDKLQSMFAAYEKDLPTLSASDKSARENQLQTEDQKFARMRDEFQRDLNNRRNEELQVLLDKANEAVKQVAASEKFDLILTEAAFAKPEFDITDKVLAILNK